MGDIDPGHALQVVREAALACTRCPLAATRTHVVFGRGDPSARLMLVGEAPGTEEDLSGSPFVGSAGRGLSGAVAEAKLSSEPSYITNVVKCRPPGDRRPMPSEVDACRPYLDLELLILRPRVVVALGVTATRRLVDVSASLGELAGRLVDVDGSVRIATFHPSPSSLNRDASRRPRLVASLLQARELLGRR